MRNIEKKIELRSEQKVNQKLRKNQKKNRQTGSGLGGQQTTQTIQEELANKTPATDQTDLLQKKHRSRQLERVIRSRILHMKELSFMSPAPIVAFDLELAGSFADDIIEIGAIRIDPLDDHIRIFSSLVRPRTFVNRTVRKMTGITKEQLRDKKTIAEVLPEFLSFVGDDSVMLGHAIGDNDLLSINLAMSRLRKCAHLQRRFYPRYIDTVRVAQRVLPKSIKKFNLQFLLEQFGWKAKQLHRALDDAIAAYLLFQMLLDYQGRRPTWIPDILDMSEGEALLKDRFFHTPKLL